MRYCEKCGGGYEETGDSFYSQSVCPECADVSNKGSLDDYEPCADCGYDHSYEPLESQAWHKKHGAPSIGVSPYDTESERERKLRGEAMVIRGSMRQLMESDILTDDADELEQKVAKKRTDVSGPFPTEPTEYDMDAMPLGIGECDMDEVAPPGWEGTVKAMKKHKEIENPWALAWSMKNKGQKSHVKEAIDYDMVSAADDAETMENLCNHLAKVLRMGSVPDAQNTLQRIDRYLYVMKQGLSKKGPQQ